jgi:AraC-like DNA-binding protein
MIERAEDLARTPNGGADPLSAVLSIVRARGDRAAVLAPMRPQSLLFPARAPCLHHVQSGEIASGSGPGIRHAPRERTGAAPAWRCAPGRSERRGRRAEDIDEFLDADSNVTDGRSSRAVHTGVLGKLQLRQRSRHKGAPPLPPVIVLSDLKEHPIDWLDLVCDLILQENEAGRPGAAVMVSRLLDLLLIQILRRWAQSADSLPGWLAAAKDDRIARAVAAIHQDPAQDWTNERLATLSGMSKSSFVERFRQVMGHQPGTYLRHWRLDRAAEALQHSNATIDAVAATVGYASQEAFSRAFQSRFGVSPSAVARCPCQIAEKLVFEVDGR